MCSENKHTEVWAQHIVLAWFVCLLAFEDRVLLCVSLCRPGWSSAQRGLPAFSSWLLGIVHHHAWLKVLCISFKLDHCYFNVQYLYQWNTNSMPSAFAVYVVNCAGVLADKSFSQSSTWGFLSLPRSRKFPCLPVTRHDWNSPLPHTQKGNVTI